jgi:hypothetical protein
VRVLAYDEPVIARWLLTALVAIGLLLPVGAPVCASNACPMGMSRRMACQATGLDCCQRKDGTVSHAAAQLPSLDLAVAPDTAPDLGSDLEQTASAEASSPLPCAAPAVLQGVGLFTLIAVFRI